MGSKDEIKMGSKDNKEINKTNAEPEENKNETENADITEIVEPKPNKKSSKKKTEEDKTVEEIFEEIKNEIAKEEKREKKAKKAQKIKNRAEENIEEDINGWKHIKYNKKNKKILIATATTVFLILAIFSTGFALANINNPGIIIEVISNDVNLKGLNREEAIEILSERLNTNLETNISIRAGELETIFNPYAIEARYNIEEIVEKAHAIGRTGNIFRNNFEIMLGSIRGRNLEPELIYNEESLNDIVEEISFRLPEIALEPSYSVQGNQLVITRGTKGNTIDMEETKSRILERNKKW